MIALVTVLAISVLIVFYRLTRDTYFEMIPRRGQIWSLLLYRELLISLGALPLTLFYGPQAFDDLNISVTHDSITNTTFVVLYAIGLFLFLIALGVRFFRIPSSMTLRRLALGSDSLHRFANAACLAGLGLLAVAIVFLSYRQAFLVSVITGKSILSVRLSNAYNSDLPSQIASLITICWNIIAIYSGVELFKNRRKIALAYLFIALILASARGDKAPIVICFGLTGLSFISLAGIRLSTTKLLQIAGLYIPIIYFIIFSVVSLQIPELTFAQFNNYLLQRLGIGQMIGTFLSLAHARISGDFFWQMIPGARFFTDYVPYDKVLMLNAENYGYADMGVMNSLFISEAYGIGGWALVIISPLIVGMSYLIGILILYKFLKSFFTKEIATIYALPMYLLNSNITGGFSSFPLFKGLMLEIGGLLVVWVIYLGLRVSLSSHRTKLIME